MKSLLAADVEEELCRQPITDADMEKMPRCRVQFQFLPLGRTSLCRRSGSGSGSAYDSGHNPENRPLKQNKIIKVFYGVNFKG
jgi:hypothetical protein